MLITKCIEIDLGHRVPNHKSKCHNLHGHRYKIEVGVNDKVVTTPGASNEGMVIDFGDLKSIMMEQINEVFDHAFVMWEKDEFAPIFSTFKEKNDQKIVFLDSVPTAENLSKLWYNLMRPQLMEKGIAIKYVKVWETPTSTATYDNLTIMENLLI